MCGPPRGAEAAKLNPERARSAGPRAHAFPSGGGVSSARPAARSLLPRGGKGPLTSVFPDQALHLSPRTRGAGVRGGSAFGIWVPGSKDHLAASASLRRSRR